MNNLSSQYPSFLKKQPVIWGISLNDLFILSGILFVLVLIGAPEILTLGATIIFYLALITARKIFPRRHFEFVLISKKTLTRKELNEKLTSL